MGEYEDRQEIIAQEVGIKIEAFAKKDFDAFLTWQSNLNTKISKSYPNEEERIKYRLYHELNGSGVLEGACPYFDFPEECSILKAVDKLKI